MTPLHELEDVLYAAARAVVGDAALAAGPLARAIIDRSRRYTSARSELSTPTDATADLAARATFFTLADAPKIAIPLAELAFADALPSHRPLRLLDLGAGCAALTLGAVSTFSNNPNQIASFPFEVTAIDRDSDALRIAGHAVRDFAKRRGVAVALTTRTADVTTADLPPADLIVLGNLLNELPAATRLPLLRRALAALAPDGALIAIEPALRDTARALHELRDAVIALGLAHVFAPCTRTLAPCPMLADPDDWCHEHRPLALPPRTAELARATHLRDSGLKFSYLVLRRDARALAEPTAWRVVGAPHAEKGKLELFGCSDAGRVRLRLLRRHRAPTNRAFEDARRGDILRSDAAPGPDRVELTAETRVELVKPAG